MEGGEGKGEKRMHAARVPFRDEPRTTSAPHASSNGSMHFVCAVGRFG